MDFEMIAPKEVETVSSPSGYLYHRPSVHPEENTGTIIFRSAQTFPMKEEKNCCLSSILLVFYCRGSLSMAARECRKAVAPGQWWEDCRPIGKETESFR